MRDFRIIILLSTGALFALAALLAAQATRTWVSGVGDDANPEPYGALQDICRCHIQNGRSR